MSKKATFAGILLTGVSLMVLLPNKVMAVVGQWSTNGNNIYYSNGLVGIGTSTTSKALDIKSGSINTIGKIGVMGLDADSGYPAGWGGGVHALDIYSQGAIGVGGANGDLKLKLTGDGNGSFSGRIGTMGFDPANGYPAGWGGGIHTWNIYAESDIGVGKAGGNINAKITSDGNGNFNGKVGTLGFDPVNGYPSGWGGGIHTWDIYSESAIGLGKNSNLNIVLTSDGTIKAKQIIVTQNVWPDYVFDKNYKLMSLKDTEQFIKANNHLPGIQSADAIKKDDISLGDMQKKQMEKIEELTLNLINIDKKVNTLEEQNKLLKEDISLLKIKLKK